ncbi:MAG: hypothetical protein JW770_03450 [Actinobacteria bacterium]|nr:hypothetical protein [Actinomycetota bacterium]
MKFRLNAPTKIIFWICVILAIIAAILFIIGGSLTPMMPALLIVGFGVLAVAFILLLLGVILEKI